MLLALLTNLKVYSQKIVLDSKGDTTICFSVSQGKYLLKMVAELEKCDTLMNVCEIQLKEHKKYIKDKDKIIRNIMNISDNQNTMLKLKEGQIDILKLDLEKTKKEVRKHKVQKWIAVGGGIAVSLFSGYYILTH